MIHVNNKKTVYHVADTAFHANKMRNLFAVIAIVLTTVLFTALFTIGGSLMASMEESVMRQVGGNAHGGFKYLTMDEYNKLKDHPSIKEIGYTVVLAVAENEKLAKRPTEIRYADSETAAKMYFALPTVGRMPEADNEIATDTIVLKQLGIPAELGQKIELEFSVGEVHYTETFTLVGYWEGDIISSASQVWLNRGYIEKILSQYDEEKLKDNVIGTVNADFNFSNSWQIEKKIRKVIADSGYDVDEIHYGVNWAYAGGNESLSAGTILGAVIIILMIVFCGYLIISNVFLISVSKDVSFYGLLKTIGMTGRQITLLLRRQTYMLCFIAIPIGLIVGYGVGAWLTPVVLSILNTNVIKVYFRVWIFVFSALFSLLTVQISIRKPSKLAAKVSPIEALRTSDGSQSIANKKQKSKKIRLFHMAWGNVIRNKKKTVFVIISLSFSLIILNSAYSLAKGFDMDFYLSSMISHDFVLGDVSCFNVHKEYWNQETLSKELVDSLEQKDGVERLGEIYFYEKNCSVSEQWDGFIDLVKEEGDVSADWIAMMEHELAEDMVVEHIYGVDDMFWKEAVLYEGEIDLEKLYSGNYVVVSTYDEEGKLSVYHVGDSVELFGSDGTVKRYEVMAVAAMPHNLSIKHSHPIESNFYMPCDVFLSDIIEKCPMYVTLDVDKGNIEDMEQYLKTYCNETDINMQYESRATIAAEYQNTQRTYKSVGIVISGLLALIGLVNFTNTSVTSIMSRKRELAMLQSIGMTDRQQNRMLILEGMIYILFTTMFTMTIGVLLGAGALKLLLGEGGYIKATFTVVPSIACLPVLFLICGTIPYICHRIISKKSIVERLRECEA